VVEVGGWDRDLYYFKKVMRAKGGLIRRGKGKEKRRRRDKKEPQKG
jgi:hypothetical protein